MFKIIFKGQELNVYGTIEDNAVEVDKITWNQKDVTDLIYALVDPVEIEREVLSTYALLEAVQVFSHYDD